MADRDHRTLTLHFQGPLAEGGHVPLLVLAEKLSALQRTLYNIGSSLRGGGRRGSWKGDVTQACQLRLSRVEWSSLEVVAEVAAVTHGLPGVFDLGVDAIQKFEKTVSAVESKDSEALEALYPDFRQRARVAKSLVTLLPEDGEDYDLFIGTSEGERKLDPSLRLVLNQVSRDDVFIVDDEAIRTITGTLVRIEVQTAARQLGLSVNNRLIECHFTPEFEDAVREFIPGSLVEVEGRATLDANGEIVRLEEIIDARTVQLVPLFWRRVVCEHRNFVLQQPIQIDVEFQDDLWIHAFQRLGILAYAPARSESLDDFRTEFAALWDVIAQEDDANLTDDAIALKRRMLELVANVEPL